MCNTYTLRRDVLKASRRGGHWELTDAQLKNLDIGEQWIIRPTKAAPIYTGSEGLKVMRWGFERPWSKAINNARIEKRGTMWKKAWAEGRCLIPLSGWYEFTGEKGNMTCHLLESADGDLLLAAGLWETHGELGDCFTMIMKEADPETTLGRIHNRMPVMLNPEDGEKWIQEEPEALDWSPGVEVKQSIVPSPLKKRPETMVQTNLL